jgi:hypothetical protein
MNHTHVMRQSGDEEEVDSGMPWRVYVVEDFAFADNDDEVTSSELDVFVDAPHRPSELPNVEDAVADLGSGAANDDAPETR